MDDDIVPITEIPKIGDTVYINGYGVCRVISWRDYEVEHGFRVASDGYTENLMGFVTEKGEVAGLIAYFPREKKYNINVFKIVNRNNIDNRVSFPLVEVIIVRPDGSKDHVELTTTGIWYQKILGGGTMNYLRVWGYPVGSKVFILTPNHEPFKGTK